MSTLAEIQRVFALQQAHQWEMKATTAEQPAPITVRRPGGNPVPADSVLSLLTLAAPCGTELLVEAAGPAAEAAVSRVAAELAADHDAEPQVCRG